MQPIFITLIVVVPVIVIGTLVYLRWRTFWAGGRSKRRWILPISSIAPLVLVFVAGATVGGAPDQGVGAAMALGFIMFPISFIIAVVSAIRAWKNWRSWSRVDRLVALLPLGLYLTLVFGALLFTAFF
jgi:hypothetical protein